MALTAMNTQPVQTEQVQGAPRASAEMLMKRGKKKKVEEKEKAPMPSGPANASMLMSRGKGGR